ncbi:hypothetical protein PVAP13_2KG316169 [Panicum virgatum]|uniref:Uncharacterized protein n=1 Tax=Panicum virgatum TaxID=38727 RepID=A0A8T0WEX4_PANVG|nr:hypothetical protein PVAP13_2KG316169 [Panicum virgatum]
MAPYITTMGAKNIGLERFLVINFMQSWDGIRLPFISTARNVLRTKFLVDLLKHEENESKDNIPGEIQEILKHLRI